MQEDKVNHPKHYTNHPSGIECIEVTQYHDFCIGNAIKYLWRVGIKGGRYGSGGLGKSNLVYKQENRTNQKIEIKL